MQSVRRVQQDGSVVTVRHTGSIGGVNVDRAGDGAWVRLPRMNPEATYSLANPARYMDPATGQVLVRFVNDNPGGGAGFSFDLALVGDVE